jgi:hypothetical protein
MKKDINCAIFRHGVFKQTGQQIPPHESKAKCDAYAATGKIYGCGKPFKLVKSPEDNKTFKAIVCGYI